MTPVRINQAIAAIRAVLPMQYPVDTILHRFFRAHPGLGIHDRSFIAESVFGILRHRLFLERLKTPSSPRSLLLAYLIKIQGINLHELQPIINQSDAKWLKEIKTVKLSSQPLAVQAQFPLWLFEKLKEFLSDTEILNLGHALQQSAPLDLRVNTFIAKRDQVLAHLQQDGIQAQATPYSPVGVRLSGRPAINRHQLFLSGTVEVQDEGSQLLGYLLAPKRSEMIVDFCAGAGGKTLLLGALMQSRGRIYAFDTAEKRLKNLKPRLKRSGLSNVHPQLITNENDAKVKRLTKKIDRVLVDIPCSGLGTLRRNPDLKWRQSPQSIQILKQKQAAILTKAAKLIKPGGRLVYATCSILPEENQQIVERFLLNHPQFTLENCAQILSKQRIQLDTGQFLQLSPHQHGTDGFFAAAMTFTPT